MPMRGRIPRGVEVSRAAGSRAAEASKAEASRVEASRAEARTRGVVVEGSSQVQSSVAR